MAAFRKRTTRISVGSIFEKLWRLGPAAFVLKAIVVAVVADALLLAFILLRRTYRKRYFLPYVQNATGQLREVLGRVLGEVATPSLSLDLLQFVGDDLDELRAAAARALGHSPSGLAFDVLSELARDPIWSLH